VIAVEPVVVGVPAFPGFSNRHHNLFPFIAQI
jgi:hypothetical protein